MINEIEQYDAVLKGLTALIENRSRAGDVYGNLVDAQSLIRNARTKAIGAAYDRGEIG